MTAQAENLPHCLYFPGAIHWIVENYSLELHTKLLRETKWELCLWRACLWEKYLHLPCVTEIKSACKFHCEKIHCQSALNLFPTPFQTLIWSNTVTLLGKNKLVHSTPLFKPLQRFTIPTEKSSNYSRLIKSGLHPQPPVHVLNHSGQIF